MTFKFFQYKDLIPGVNDGYDIGSSALRWQDGYYMALHTINGVRFNDGSIQTTASSGGGGSIGGSVAANQVAFGSGTNTIQGSANLTFDGTTLTLTGTSASPLDAHSSANAEVIYNFKNPNAGTSASSLIANRNNLGSNLYTEIFGSNFTVAGYRVPDGGLIRLSSAVAASAQLVIVNGNNAPLIFGTNDVEVARFDSLGNLGIGTPSPSYPLHAKSSGSVQVAVETSSSTGFAGTRFLNSTADNFDVGLYSSAFPGTIGGVNKADASAIFANNAAPLIIGTNQSQPIVFAPNGASVNETMRITANQRVAIGTTIPSLPLHVKSASGLQIETETASNTGVAGLRSVNDTGDNFDFALLGSAFAGTFGGVNRADLAEIVANNAAPLLIGTNQAQPIVFAPNGASVSETMRITSNQRVAIGTTAPNATVEVFSSTAELRVSNEADQPNIVALGYGTAGGGNSGDIFASFARGTRASPTAVSNGDILGRMGFYGHNGTVVNATGPHFRGVVTSSGTWGTSERGSQLQVYTIPNGQAGSVLHAVFDQDGSFGIGTNATASSDNFFVTSNGATTIAPASPSGSLIVAPTGTPTGDTVAITAGALAAGKHVFKATGTSSASPSGDRTIALFDLTSAGSGGDSEYGLVVNLNAGFTGTASTFAFAPANTAQGTNGVDPLTSDLNQNVGNIGTYSGAFGSISSGVNMGIAAFSCVAPTTVGIAGYAGHSGLSNSGFNVNSLNYGLVGGATLAKNASSTTEKHIGSMGVALSGDINVGGFFGLMKTVPTFASAALMADNGAVAADIFVARDNGTAVFTIADSGNTTLASLAGTNANLRILSLNTTATAGIAQIAFPSSVTQGAGSLIAVNVDFNTNLTTPAAGQSQSIFRTLFGPTATITSGSPTFKGFDIASGGSIGAVANSGSGNVIWRGAHISMPNINNSGAGTITSDGAVALIGTMTNGGSQNGFRIDATAGAAAGTLNGINISATSGAAGKTAILVDEGWDNALNIADVFVIDGYGNLAMAPEGANSGIQNSFVLVAPDNTAQTASTEAIDVDFNLERTVEHATGALTTQRAMVVRAPTYGFVGTSTLTTAATFAITDAPSAGAHATITNAYALWVQSGRTELDGNLTVAGPNSSAANLDIETANDWGTIAQIRFRAATTQTDELSGLLLDYSTNFTLLSGSNFYGADMKLKGITTTSGTEQISGFSVSQAGALSNSTAGSISWRGADIAMPNITQGSGGSVTAAGLRLTTGTITTNGKQYGINIIANGVSAGTLAGVNISNLSSPGGGAEFGVIIGTGWDIGAQIKSPVVLQSAQTHDTSVGVVSTLFAEFPLLTAQPAHTEIVDVLFDNTSKYIEYTAGAKLSLQRMVALTKRTYRFTAASSIGTAATFYIEGAPVAGTNATIDKALALLIEDGDTQFGGAIYTNGVANTTLAATENDYAGTVGASFVRLSGAAITGSTVTGFTGGVDGKRLVVTNFGTTSITFTNQDAGSATANQFLTSTGASIVLTANHSIEFIYDDQATCWRDITG